MSRRRLWDDDDESRVKHSSFDETADPGELKKFPIHTTDSRNKISFVPNDIVARRLRYRLCQLIIHSNNNSNTAGLETGIQC